MMEVFRKRAQRAEVDVTELVAYRNHRATKGTVLMCALHPCEPPVLIDPKRKAHLRTRCLLHQLGRAEKERNLLRGRFGSVGAVDYIAFN